MAKKKAEEKQEPEVIQDAECVVWEPGKTHRVQIRLDEPGPRKKDGRRGQIVIEDSEAPDAVARWLMSPKCLKSTRGPGGRRQCFVWIDDQLWSGVSEDSPDADNPADTALVPATSPQVAETEAGRQYLAHLLSEIRFAEQDLTETRDRCAKEIKAALEFRDQEVKICNALVEDARERLAKELERESEAMEKLGERRAKQAKQMLEDDTIFGLVRSSHGKRLLQQDQTLLQQIMDFVQVPGGAMVAAGIAGKLGLPPELVLMFQGQKAPETPSE